MNFIDKVESVNVVALPLDSYIKASLDSDNEKYCKGWEYLKTNLNPLLKGFLLSGTYWDFKYNSEKVDYICKDLNVEHEAKRQVGSFVYVWNDIKRKCAKWEEEQAIIDKGYVKVMGSQKEYDGKKVKGIFKFSKLGLMGSFDKWDEAEGKLVYSDSYNTLFFMPKRSRTRGLMIRDYCFIKVVKC